MYWDNRLTQRGAFPILYAGRAGDAYYRLVRGEWLNVQEAGGLHHILVEVLDANGQRQIGIPVVLRNGGTSRHLTEAKAGQNYAAAIPMFNAGNPYSIAVGEKSDAVSGLGMGTIEAPHFAAHTSYRFVFQLGYFDAGGGVDPIDPDPSDSGDWGRILDLAEEMSSIAARHIKAAG